MTEETAFYAPDGRGTHLEELRQRREKYDRDLAARKEQQKRDEKQAELQAHLERRAKLWSDTTGSAPSRSVLERWQQEYVDNKHAEKQAEREAAIFASVEHLGI